MALIQRSAFGFILTNVKLYLKETHYIKQNYIARLVSSLRKIINEVCSYTTAILH